MENTQNIDTKENSDDTLDLAGTLFRYVQYWKLVVAIVLASLLIGIVYLIVSPKEYSSSASILLKEDNGKKGASGGGLDLESIGLMPSVNNIDNEITILTSPDLMLQVVKNLDVNYSYHLKKRLREIDIYDTSPYYAKLNNDSILDHCHIEFSISSDEGKHKISGFFVEDKVENDFSYETTTFPFEIDILGAKLNISSNKNLTASNGVKSTDEIFIKIQNPIAVADAYAKGLSISTATKYASVLHFQINTSNQKKGEDILSKLIVKYNEDNVGDKNLEAYNMSLFIKERIDDIAIELGDVEKDVESYKQTQGITNLSGEAQLYMQQTAVNIEKQAEVETQLKIVEMVENFITNPNNEGKPIPNIGLTDPGLVASVSFYNEKLLGYSGVMASAGKESPTRQRVETEMLLMKENILNLVRNVKQSVLITKHDINRLLSANSGKIHSLPMQERGLLEKMRQQQIKETLYLFLLQKREETNIKMASNSDKAKIVMKPRSANAPVNPNSKMTLLGALIIGFIASLLVIYLKLLFRNKIECPDDLEKMTHIPIIGHIVRSEEESSIVSHSNSNTSVAELFRYLRNSIEFVLEGDDNKVILVTSTTAGEGKTFIAANLASSLALNDKKVLLVGLDIRNPQLSSTFGMPKSHGLTDYISGGVKDWKTLLSKPTKDIPNLDVLQGGTIPPNPNELLKSKKIGEFINEIRNEYDIIVLDTAPVGIISDTFLLSKYADFTLYVTREKVTFRSAVPFINAQYKEKRFPNMYIVLNDVTSTSGSYKYGAYGYPAKKVKKNKFQIFR